MFLWMLECFSPLTIGGECRIPPSVGFVHGVAKLSYYIWYLRHACFRSYGEMSKLLPEVIDVAITCQKREYKL